MRRALRHNLFRSVAAPLAIGLLAVCVTGCARGRVRQTEAVSEVSIPIADGEGAEGWNAYVSAVRQVRDENAIRTLYGDPQRLSPIVGNSDERRRDSPRLSPAIAKVLASNSSALSLVHEGLEKPCRVPNLELRGPSDVGAAGGMKALGVLLLLEGRQQEMGRQPARAFESYQSVIRFGQQLRATAVGALLVGTRSIMDDGCREMRAGLRTGVPMTDSQIEDNIVFLNRAIAGLPAIRSLLARERDAAVGWVEVAVPQESEVLADARDQGGDGYTPDLQVITRQIRGYYTAAVRAAALPCAEALATEIPRPSDPIAAAVCDDFRVLVYGEYRLRAALLATRLCFAVRRYQETNRVAPSTLGAMVPSFLSTIPTDPITGEAFRIRSEGERYLVYSIGPDGQDDGGMTVAASYGQKGDFIY